MRVTGLVCRGWKNGGGCDRGKDAVLVSIPVERTSSVRSAKEETAAAPTFFFVPATVRAKASHSPSKDAQNTLLNHIFTVS
jgi:hypothetical protein